MTSYTDENIDEKIVAQQAEIEKSIAETQPLISPKYDLESLLNEYLPEDSIFIEKIQYLCKKFKYIRKTRGDGNCFFRAFGFCYLESILNQKNEIEKFREVVKQCATDLTAFGYQSFTIDDFKDVLLEVLDKLEENATSDSLQEIFCDSVTSDYIVVYLRLIVSCYLQKNEEFFQCFIENYTTIKDFCIHEVEPMYRESDHIHIIALTNAINTPVSIIYLDRTDQKTTVTHNFPEDSEPKLYILYRPGHYDIIYQ